jgi:hypothetical protein
MRDKLEVKVPKDILKYKESILLGLNLRQVVCSVLALLISVGIYFLTKDMLGKETASWLCIVGASPFAVAGFFSYNSLTIEQFLGEIIRTCFIQNGKRFWQNENKLYEFWKGKYYDKNNKKPHSTREKHRRKKTKDNSKQHTNQENL